MRLSSTSQRVIMFGSGLLAGAAIVAGIMLVRHLRADTRNVYGEELSQLCTQVHRDAKKALDMISAPGGEQAFGRIFYDGRSALGDSVLSVWGDAPFVEYCGARTEVTAPGLLSFQEFKKYAQDLVTSIPESWGTTYPKPLGTR